MSPFSIFHPLDRPRGRGKPAWDRLESGLYVPPVLSRQGRPRMSPGYPCCCGNDLVCIACSGIVPQNLQVVLSGIVNLNPANVCANCSDLDGTYIVTYVGNCYWFYNLGDEICPTAGNLSIAVQVSSKTIQVYLDTSSYDSKWYKVFPSAVPCNSLNNESLAPNIYTMNLCDVSAATCFVTSL